MTGIYPPGYSRDDRHIPTRYSRRRDTHPVQQEEGYPPRYRIEEAIYPPRYRREEAIYPPG